MKQAKATRVEGAYAQLKEEMRANRMPPGFQMSEPELALRLGMSRTPVREALIRLEGEGLVELVPRHGVRVLSIQPQDMAEIYEILGALEPEAAAAVAARNPSEEDIIPLVQATDEMERALKQKDRDAWVLADEAFHKGMLQLNGNRRLIDYLSTLYDQSHRARMITWHARPSLMLSTEEHREILTLLLNGGAGATREAFRAHNQRASGEALKVLKQLHVP